jgi:hypothetical protein
LCAAHTGGRKMIEKDGVPETNTTEAQSGQGARRKFLKQSGRMAVAAPAVVLLLSAQSRGAAAAVDPPYRDPT